MNRSPRYIRLPRLQRRLVSVLLGGFVVLLVNSALLVLFDRSTALVYMSNVLLHVVLGVLLIAPAAWFLVVHLAKMPLRRNLRATAVGVATALSLGALLASGVGLVALGATWAGGLLLGLHLWSIPACVVAFFVHVSLKRGLRYGFLEWRAAGRTGVRRVLGHPFGATLVLGAGLLLLFAAVPLLDRPTAFVDGTEDGPLTPSQSVLAHEGFLEVEDLTRSNTCGQAGCHPDITAQWAESAHRFSSFNNPYYRKSVETMIARGGNGPARWCASCHDPALLFTGRFEDEVEIDGDAPAAHEGLTCLSCHAIEGLRDVKGNGRYVLAKPDEYPFARAQDGLARAVHNRLVRAKPEPHRQAMLKPVHRTQEFCGTCHKVSIPPEVNNYRWKRGQNEYDAWHASGASGNTVRSFYLPKQPATCTSCHMPLVPSSDQGNDDGFVRSHRFAAANTALPHVMGHPDQLVATRRALEDSIATIDLAVVEVDGQVYGPDDALPALRPGAQVRLTAVVRNRKVGHGLPGGTNDSNELWLELIARDATGGVVLSSGHLDPRGRVDSTAHRWGAVQVDRAARPIDKRNVQDWITTVYANVIGPGTAHAVHYRFTVPSGAPVVAFEAALRHRKFKWYYNEWTFRGQVAPGEPDSLARPEVDGRRWVLGEGRAPELPITTLARSHRIAGEPPAVQRPLWERWNDLGIGLLLQGDTRGALAAFGRVSAAAPENPEGPVNEARVLLAEGQLDRAAERLDEAERRRPGYLKPVYFRGELAKAEARYDDALAAWMRVYEAYPQDRVLLQNIGRVHYLEGRYDEALVWVDRVLDIDPEDVGALYNRMLTLGALGEVEALRAAQARYTYHKDDEDAMAVAAPFKQRHPTVNREAQSIHEHELHQVNFDAGHLTGKGLRAGARDYPVRSAHFAQ